MAENVQCPVCTLYLHAGMNLSDHLETHPKEQVIRALVQMTISGVGFGSNNVLASVLAGGTGGGGDNSAVNDTKKSTSTLEVEEKPLPSDKNNDLNIGSTNNSCSAISISNSASNCSFSNQSTASSQNSINTINFNPTANIEHNIEQESTTSSSSATPVKQTIKTEPTTPNSKKSKLINANIDEGFAAKQGFSQTSSTNANQAYHSSPVIELPNSNNNQTNFTVFGNQRYEQHQQRSGLCNQNQLHTPHMPPPPPPPQPTPSQQTSQHPGQHQEISRNILPLQTHQQSPATGSSGGSFPTLQQPLPPPPHHSSLHLGNAPNNHRQSHMFSGQHQQPPNSHHQQNLKVIYTPALPPPPPLQLFTYQPPTHLQHHQKPPPAYGTAISQIRSQHNQNKHQVTGSLITQHQNSTLQTHHASQQQQQQQQHVQQPLHHNMHMHVPPPPPPPPPVPTKHLINNKPNELIASPSLSSSTATTTRHNHQQQQHQQHHLNKTFTELSQQQQQQHHNHQQQSNSSDIQQQTQNSNYHGLTTNDLTTKITKGTATTSTHNNPAYPQVSISPSTASASMAAVAAASTLGRHTNSPFAALLAAAAGAPSPSSSSSVLRYAESPVAHYLERDNGDFIVQETPKHIVECVEKDNGEFSVIERIYQSPPSVLHIHDDDDDDDDDDEDEDDDDDNEDAEANVDFKDNIIASDDDEQDMEIKNKTSRDEITTSAAKSFNKMSLDSKKSHRKSSKHADDNVSSDNEIVDFVSISSDSEEEEFISHERKEHKNANEKSKKPEASPTYSSTLMSSTLTSPTTSSSVNVEHHLTPTPSLTSLHSSSSISINSQTHQSVSSSSSSGTSGTSRKKSSKNTVTVLSDVQLNLNEYLDLVGNIIASSKVAAHRKTFATLAPIPMVKIEKEEPMDDYVETTATTTMITSDATTICNNFEQATTTPPPLKANKHETDEIETDKPSSSNKHTNNHNISLIDELQQQQKAEKEEPEDDEKKPQVLEKTQENGEAEISNSISNSNCTANSKTTINSSHVTSVIRMATTSQHLNKTNNDSPTEAEDLSQPQRKSHTTYNTKSLTQSAATSLQRKGPKKLVIKPKSSKTEVLTLTHPHHDQRQQQPTTSAKAALLEEYSKQNHVDVTFNSSTDQVQVKNEPITSIAYENHQYSTTTGFSILEQHLNSKDPLPIMECKEEKPCITEANLSTTIKEMKIENNVNDDARVLYDFANSKKPTNSNNNTAAATNSTTFPSSSSLFSNNLTAIEHHSSNMTTEAVNNIEDKNINQDLDTSSYSSQSAMDARMTSEENSITATDHQHHNQPTHVFTDFPFSYLYNGNNMTEQVDIKNHQQFNTFYPNVNTTIDDSSSSKQYTDYPTSNIIHKQQQQHHPQAGTSQQIQQHHQHQWFDNNNHNQNNYQTSDINNSANISVSSNHSVASNLNSSISVDGANNTLDNNAEVGKYLDLDACKREQNSNIIVGDGNDDRVVVPPPPSSSTSCSYTGTTDNSMAGICSTAATLNIRTDEKMPAKGEISEQESNCDIDNSWSQPMYGDISARFFKTTFPGIFPQDNGWNHDDYFTVQDLSASTTAQATNANSRMKSFEFRLPLDANSACGSGNTSNSNSNSNNNSGLPIFSQNSNDNCNIDVMPSTSAKIRKRRKRNSQDGKTTQTNAKRIQPTSTITSQQMMMQHQDAIEGGVDFNFQQPQQQQQQQQQNQQQHLQQPSTSTAFLAGPSNASSSNSSISTAASSSSFMLQQQQTQQKQRTKVYECGHCNAKYSKLRDRNAHMVDVHNYVRQNRRLVCPTTGLATPLSNADMQDVALPTTSAASSIVMPPLQNADCLVGDYKQGIVKIENENIPRDLADLEPPINADLRAKNEIMEDDKQNLSLVPLTASSSANIDYVDTKPPTGSLPLSLTTPTSKLTTLYRMLVSFNMTTLKQNQSLSEFDENLIKSSIFFCYVCRQNFNSVKLYDAHLTEHPADCFTCGKKFQRWKNFSLHLKRHLGWKEFGCTVCDKKFVVRSALVEHMRMHSGLSPLKCKVCGKHFKRYSNLTQHRKRHTKQIIRRKEYVCYCGEVLPSKARFLWHKETHDSKPKCCPHCCDRFVHVNSLRRHIRLAHSDKFDYTEPMECPICKQIFAKASMKAHMATHSTETQYDCAICNKSFSTKWNLKIHSWVHANRTSKPFKCEHCPKAFVREVDFKNHINSHKQIKPYTCEVCGCKFIRKYNYMRHRREHHGNKKYTCDLCKKSFHRHYYLIEHRRIHTGERPFQCTICGKSSTTKTNHNKHLKIHHSRDPFTVEV